MDAKLKCSNCGAEISNLHMSWGKKYGYWFIPVIILIMSFPLVLQFIMKDKNDFRLDLVISGIEKNYTNGIIEIFGVIENHGKVDWGNITVEAELFDKNGKFIDELTRRISASLLPGSSEHFKISSKEFSKSRWNSLNNLKVRASEAYHSNY